MDATVSIPEGEQFTEITLQNRAKGTSITSVTPGDVSEYNLTAALDGVKHASLSVGVDNSAGTSHKTFTVNLDSETPDDLTLSALTLQASSGSGMTTIVPTPAFDPDVTTYRYNVSSGTTTLRVSATKSDPVNTFFGGADADAARMNWALIRNGTTVSSGSNTDADADTLTTIINGVASSGATGASIRIKVVGLDGEKEYRLTVVISG